MLVAHRMATAFLGLQEEKLRRPRTNEGIRQGLRILLSVRESMAYEQTGAVNALKALVHANLLGVDARRKLTVTSNLGDQSVAGTGRKAVIEDLQGRSSAAGQAR